MIKMQYPDGSIHDIEPSSLISFQEDGKTKYVLYYVDHTQGSASMFTVLDRRDGYFVKVPLNNRMEYSRLQAKIDGLRIFRGIKDHDISELDDFIRINNSLRPQTQTQRCVEVYTDHNGHYWWYDGRDFQDLSYEGLQAVLNDPTIKVEYKTRHITEVLPQREITIYTDFNRHYWLDKDGKEPIDADKVKVLEEDPSIKVIFKQALFFTTRVKTPPIKNFDQKVIIIIYTDFKNHYWGDPECKRPLSPEYVESLKKDPRYEIEFRPANIKKEEEKTEQVIEKRPKIDIFVDGEGHYFYDFSGKNEISERDLENIVESGFEVHFEFTATCKHLTIYTDNVRCFIDPNLRIVLSTDNVEQLFHMAKVRIPFEIPITIERQNNIKVGRDTTIYKDENGNYYLDEKGTKPISQKSVETLSSLKNVNVTIESIILGKKM